MSELYEMVSKHTDNTWNAALDLAAKRINQLALDDNTIKTCLSIIEDCRAELKPQPLIPSDDRHVVMVRKECPKS